MFLILEYIGGLTLNYSQRSLKRRIHPLNFCSQDKRRALQFFYLHYKLKILILSGRYCLSQTFQESLLFLLLIDGLLSEIISYCLLANSMYQHLHKFLRNHFQEFVMLPLFFTNIQNNPFFIFSCMTSYFHGKMHIYIL